MWRNCNEKAVGFKWPQNSIYAQDVHFSHDPVLAKLRRKGVHSRANSAMLEKKKSHFNWQDKHRQNTRYSQYTAPSF